MVSKMQLAYLLIQLPTLVFAIAIARPGVLPFAYGAVGIVGLLAAQRYIRSNVILALLMVPLLYLEFGLVGSLTSDN